MIKYKIWISYNYPDGDKRDKFVKTVKEYENTTVMTDKLFDTRIDAERYINRLRRAERNPPDYFAIPVGYLE